MRFPSEFEPWIFPRREAPSIDWLISDLKATSEFIRQTNPRAARLKYLPGEFVLAFGRPMESEDGYDIILGERNNCFCNAGELALLYPDSIYCEGFVAISEKATILHAWLLEDGKVVDPTLGYDPSAIYYGVPIKTEYLRKSVKESDSWSVIYDNDDPSGLLVGTIDPAEAILQLEDKENDK